MIAAIVTPSIIQDSSRTTILPNIKKSISILSEAQNRIKADNGGSMIGVASTSDELKDAFAKKMSIVKECYGANHNDCYNITPKNLHGNNFGYSLASYPVIIGNNGFIYIFFLMDSNCSSKRYTKNGKYQNCGVTYIDINGTNPPNTVGKDVFYYEINNYNITPRGNDYSCWSNGSTSNIRTASSYCNPANTTLTTNGLNCAAKFLEKNKVWYYGE